MVERTQEHSRSVVLSESPDIDVVVGGSERLFAVERWLLEAADGAYVGVPVLRASGGARSCWLLEPDGPGAARRPDPVKQMVEFGSCRAAMRTVA
ncbi:hypothetical protein M4J06_005159 [Streptomyces coelicoflavus]|uniref:hypothetical protein n=1 Tax=Streptomyces coelicoflavus TaxID=285562 RepID=UPI00210D4EB2|nr:hypothetical protein [Streptomyces coelicoflavus]MCQ4201096.1 hypothetical protein [Streptomyces coelicoflavus]